MSVDGVEMRLFACGTSLARADLGEWLGTPVEDQRVARVEYDIVAWGADECTIRAPDGQWGDALLGQVQLIQAPVGHPATWANPQLAHGVAIRQAQQRRVVMHLQFGPTPQRPGDQSRQVTVDPPARRRQAKHDLPRAHPEATRHLLLGLACADDGEDTTRPSGPD